MGIPNVIYLDYGDEKKVGSSTQAGTWGVLPFGTPGVLPDGRMFRYAKEGATPAVAGKLYVSEAPVGNDGAAAAKGLVSLAGTSNVIVVGSKTVILTTGGTTAITKDQYAGGYLTFQAGTAGIGYQYRIKNNTASASTAAVTVTITLDDNDPIAATIAAGTTTIGLLQNPFKNLVLRAAASSQVAAYAGVWPCAVPANSCGWIQRHGLVPLLTGASALVIGAPVVACTATPGAVVKIVTAATASLGNDYSFVGWAQTAPTAGEYANVFLTLE